MTTALVRQAQRLTGIFALMMLTGVLPVTAFELPTGSLPQAFEPAKPVAIPADQPLRIRGVNESDQPVKLFVRVDDKPAPPYGDRFDAERVVPPGPFEWRISAPLKTPSGRALNPGSITRVIIFKDDKAGPVRVSEARFPDADAAAAPKPTPQAQAARQAPMQEASMQALATGPLPIEIEPGQPITMGRTGRIRITGTNRSNKPAQLVLRIDDKPSPPYADRFNREFTAAPGKFSWFIPVTSIAAENGRALNRASITRMILFTTTQDAQITIASFQAPLASKAPPAAPRTASTAPQSDTYKRQVREPTTIGSGTNKVEYEPSGGTDIRDFDEILVQGVARTEQQVGLVFRVDDGASSSYNTRHNQERMLPPGPFRFTVGVRGLRTTGKRPLNLADIRKIIVAKWEGDGDVEIERVVLRQSAALPAGVRAYAFGAADAPLPPGFERLSPSSAAVKGVNIRARRRPMPDALVANGLEGVTRVELPDVPRGRYRVTIWSEDPGEWEILPQTLQQTISVNGVPFINRDLSAEQWISQRYLAGKTRAHTASDDAWSAFGQYRGNRTSRVIAVGDSGIRITMDGDRPAAFYLSALVIEPEDSTAGQAHATAYRRAWYRDNFPVREAQPRVPKLAYKLEGASNAPVIQRTAARGSGVRLSFQTSDMVAGKAPFLRVRQPVSASGRKLTARLWVGIPKLERLNPQDTTLSRTTNHLYADQSRITAQPGEPTVYEMWIAVPRSAQPGVYRGAVLTESGRERTFEITVLPLTLSPASKPTGFYLAYPHHLDYFRRLRLLKDRQAACDLRFMTVLGLQGTAPPVTPLGPRTITQFRSDMQRARNLGVARNWLAYNPIEFLQQSYAVPVAAEIVGRAMQSIRGAGLAPPLWSAADEPSNPDRGSQHLAKWTKALRAAAPGIKLGGHFNNPGDRPFAELFDTLIVNPGYGLDVNDISAEVRAGREIWFYNTFKPRVTAGLWLWRTQASRYVQWHARMPTADPFDPLDGREGDVQALLPSAEVCPAQPDIHRDLLEMAEGTVDQQWLDWLSRQKGDPAKRLSSRISNLFGARWKKVSETDAVTLAALRAEIVDLYKRTRGN